MQNYANHALQKLIIFQNKLSINNHISNIVLLHNVINLKMFRMVMINSWNYLYIYNYSEKEE